jgi:hypothetical protein
MTMTTTAEKTKPVQPKVYSPSALRNVRTVQTGHLPTAHTKRIHTSNELRGKLGGYRPPQSTSTHQTHSHLLQTTFSMYLPPLHHITHHAHRERQSTYFITTHPGVCTFLYYTQDTNNTLHFGNLRRGQRGVPALCFCSVSLPTISPGERVGCCALMGCLFRLWHFFFSYMDLAASIE